MATPQGIATTAANGQGRGIHPSSAIVPNADGGRDFQFIGAAWFNDLLFPYRSPV
jgi:hypothetical protein